MLTRVLSLGRVPFLQRRRDLHTGASLLEWATEVTYEQAASLAAELGMSFSGVRAELLTRAPVEIVVEWNADLPRP
jgi:hypothetical protein